MGGDVESVLKEVGFAEDGTQRQGAKEGQGEERVWLHCIVGGKLDEKKPEEPTEEEVNLRTLWSELMNRRPHREEEDLMSCSMPDYHPKT